MSQYFDNIKVNKEKSGRLLFDVLEVFLKQNYENIARNKFVSVVFHGFKTDQVDNLRRYFRRINHAMAYLSEHIITPAASTATPNYDVQKLLIDHLMYNYLEKMARPDLTWCQAFKRISAQHDCTFQSIRMDYDKTKLDFSITSQNDLVEIHTKENLQAIIAIRDDEIATLNGGYTESSG